MANPLKDSWWVLLLVAAGAAVLLISLQSKQEPAQGVVLQEVFKQQPSSSVGEKDPVVSPAIVTSPENGHEAEFAVQVYSFQDRGRAEKALAGLKEAGYKSSYMEVSDLGPKGTWYRVRIGGLEDEAKATTVLAVIRKDYKSGFIVKPKNK